MQVQAIDGKPLSAGGKLLKASAGGGTAIDLGVTGAAVGDIIKVAAVDADGKPTAWAAAELAGGAVETITLNEDVAAISYDLNGCDEFALVLEVPVVAENRTYCFPIINSTVGSFITFNYGNTTNKCVSLVQLNKIDNGIWRLSFKPGNEMTFKNSALNKVGDIPIVNNTIFTEITSLGLNAYGSQTIPAGTKIYVVRGKVIL